MRVHLVLLLLALSGSSLAQVERQLGKLTEVFAWKQITFNINGNMLLQDRFGEEDLAAASDDGNRQKRQSGGLVFTDNDDDRDWNRRPSRTRPTPSTSTTTASTPRQDDSRSFFIQYNNLPMGVERDGNRLFITLPRRRYGIPSTLNYLDLTRDSYTRSPGLRPYPDIRRSRTLTSVYRTRIDQCRRLWMVDTGLLEIPNNFQQVQQPAIVVFDLNTDRQILRYPLKNSDLVSNTTPTGLASITVDVVNNDCANTYAYIPDLTTYGLIVFSLRENDSWRLRHNYFSFNPLAGNLNIAGQRFQWNDGIFSLTLTPEGRDGCRTAYFHAMVGTTEHSVSTCVLRNQTAGQSDNFWTEFSIVGDRGANSQSTMHGYHAGTNVVLFADIARSALSCWNTANALTPSNVQILAQDSLRFSYPADLHVTGDEVWLMANSLPTWAYSRLNTDRYNFFIYRANINELIAGTVCTGRPSFRSRSGAEEGQDEEHSTKTE